MGRGSRRTTFRAGCGGLVAVLGLAAGCTRFGAGLAPSTDLDAGETDAVGSDLLDGGSPALDARVDVVPGPPKLPPNGDFETPGPGCGPTWEETGWHSTYARSSTARSGSSACQVCPAPGETVFSLDPGDVVKDVKGGERWEVRAFVRRAPASSGTSIGTFVALRVYASNGRLVDSDFGDQSPLTDTWQELRLDYLLKAGGTLNGYVSFENDAGGCVLVDDFELVRLE